MMRRLLSDQQGATIIEYAFIIAVIVLVMLAGLSKLGDGSTGLWGQVKTKASNAM